MNEEQMRAEFEKWYDRPTTDRLYADYATWQAAHASRQPEIDELSKQMTDAEAKLKALGDQKPAGYVEREQFERWSALRGTQYEAPERCYMPFSVVPFKSELSSCDTPLYFKPFPSRQAEIDAIESLSVTKILLKVVPGDGNGEEVYAKSVSEVEDLLGEQGLQMEEYELGIKIPAGAQTLLDALKAELARSQNKCEGATTRLEAANVDLLRYDPNYPPFNSVEARIAILNAKVAMLTEALEDAQCDLVSLADAPDSAYARPDADTVMRAAKALSATEPEATKWLNEQKAQVMRELCNEIVTIDSESKEEFIYRMKKIIESAISQNH